MKILVAGGAGFVGANLVRRCLGEPGAEVTVLDSLDSHFQSTTECLRDVWDRINFVQGDLRDDDLLADLVKHQETIFNCAGQTSHPRSLLNPVLDVELNCLASIKLLEAAREHNSNATLVFASSSTVVGKTDADAVDENQGERPLDIYSANKGAAEKYYQVYHSAHDLRTACIRLPNLYGPFGKVDSQFGFINYFISRAIAGDTLPIFGDGHQKRNVLYVEDAAEIMWCAATDERLSGSIYSAAGDEHLPVLSIAEAIVEVFGKGSIEHVEWPDDRRRMEIGDARISSERLRTITGWRPRHDLRSGLEKTRDGAA